MLANAASHIVRARNSRRLYTFASGFVNSKVRNMTAGEVHLCEGLVPFDNTREILFIALYHLLVSRAVRQVLQRLPEPTSRQ